MESRIQLFVRENYRFSLPCREDLFLRQIEVLDRDYNLKESWNAFNSMLDRDFEGNLQKFDELREQYCSDIRSYYKKHNVTKKAIELVQNRNYQATEYAENQVSGHTYLKLDAVHAFNQVLSYFNLVPDSEEQIISKFAPTRFIGEARLPRIIAIHSLDFTVMAVLAEQLLRKALEGQDNPLVRQLQITGIPIIRKDVDDFIYDITGFEDTFSSFIGQQVSNGVKLHVSMFKQDSMIFYYDYALHIAPVQIDWVTGQKDFGGFEFREFLPQLACIDQGWPISEKDLWWQDRDGLHRHNKPIRQVLLGPETVVE